MKMFNEQEKNTIISEFNNRNGMYTRLYDKLNNCTSGNGEPIGIMYRCESNVDKDRIIVLRYTWNQNRYLNKREFEEQKLKGMAFAIKKADRYLKKCQKNKIEVEDYCELFTINNHISKQTDDSTKEYLDVFKNRIQKYYKKDMKMIVIWM